MNIIKWFQREKTEEAPAIAPVEPPTSVTINDSPVSENLDILDGYTREEITAAILKLIGGPLPCCNRYRQDSEETRKRNIEAIEEVRLKFSTHESVRVRQEVSDWCDFYLKMNNEEFEKAKTTYKIDELREKLKKLP